MKYTREQIEEKINLILHIADSMAHHERMQDGFAAIGCRENIESALKELTSQLIAENDALREDAERYRLLRRKVCITGGKFHILNLDPRYIAPDAAVELDAAIDAARKKG